MNLPKTIDPTKIPIKSSTQQHLDIEDVLDDIVILKDGSSCLVISTTAINFGLLSEKEQDATIYAYAGLLNSLTFSIQIVMRSQRKDISAYLKLLDETEAKEMKKEIKEQIQKYRRFIQETIAKNNVLDKNFFIVIPMSALELGVKQAFTSVFGKKSGLPFEKDYILKKAKTNLYPKRDHVLRQLNRLGLKGHQVKTQELIKLFFRIYNPGAGGQQLTTSQQYQAPLVEPAMAKAKLTPPTTVPTGVYSQPPKENDLKVETRPLNEDSIQNQIDGLVKEAIKK